jgi:hypothetical protein
MAGDNPMDLRDELFYRYNDGDKCYFEFSEEEIKAKIEEDFRVLLIEAEKMDNFAFPFAIIDYGVVVPEDCIDRVIELIGDGDGGDRGYEQEQVGTVENNFNNLQCPQDYCDQLRHHIKDILAKRVKAEDVLTECVGLLSTIGNHIADPAKTGLVNTL